MQTKNMQKRCYFGCKLDGPLHSFPSPVYPHEDRFNKWKSVLSEDIKNKGNSYIYGNVRFCGRHFELKYHTRGKRLTANSVPTLNLCIPQTVQILEPDLMTHSDNNEPSRNISIEQISQPSSTTAVNSTREGQEITNASVSNQPIKVIGKKHKVLTSEKINYLKEYSKLKVRLLKAQEKCKTLTQNLRKAEKISKHASFIKAIENLPEPSFLFTKMQQQYKKKPRGRRFTTQEKILALTIYKQSQKAYNLMRSFFVLPSKRSLQKVLSLLPLKPGINDFIFENLKKKVAKIKTDEKKLCTLLFDEVALSPGLHYAKHDDEIIGFEDFGEHKTTKIADHALVFMIKGIKAKYKQPICFTFCQSSTKKDELKCLIRQVIRKVHATGLRIIATICDQGGPNMSAINSLMTETKEKYVRQGKEYKSMAFEVDNRKIFPIFDPPHLLKGVRNNFIDKELRFIYKGEVKCAQWEHLKMFLAIDVGDDDVRLLNKITEQHVYKEKIPKMKVKYAAQVFSQRMSAALRFLAKHNILPKECEDTADFLLIMDKLFDSFNGHSYSDSAKIFKGCLKSHSPHFKLWDELLPILRSMQFKTTTKKRDGTEETKYIQVPSLKNWIHNINVFKEMFKYLNEQHKITSLLTRNFNQDPLENFFSIIRSNGIRNVSPSCSQFISAFKTLLVNNFSSVHAVGANCEEDFNKPLQSLKHLLKIRKEAQQEQEMQESAQIDPILELLRDEEHRNKTLVNEESKRYVGGYIIKKCKNIYKGCSTCNSNMSKNYENQESYTFERDVTKRSLNYPSDEFHYLVSEIFKITNKTLSSYPEKTKIKENIKLMVESICDFSFLTCAVHKKNIIHFIVNMAITLIIHSWCTGVNRILSGKITNFDRGDKIKLQAERYCNTHKRK